MGRFLGSLWIWGRCWRMNREKRGLGVWTSCEIFWGGSDGFFVLRVIWFGEIGVRDIDNVSCLV